MEKAQTSDIPKPNYFNRVTLLSKALAMILFITLPIGAFFLGRYYEKGTNIPVVPYQPIQPVKQSTGETKIVPTTTQDETASWPTYTNTKVGYSFRASPLWKVAINTDDSRLARQDYLSNIELTPKDEPEGIQLTGVAIPFPFNIKGPRKELGNKFDQGLKGLESYSSWGIGYFDNGKYTAIDGKQALIVRSSTYNKKPPENSVEWCEICFSKNVFINLNNGKILEIDGRWTSKDLDFEKLFDKFYTTIKFNLSVAE